MPLSCEFYKCKSYGGMEDDQKKKFRIPVNIKCGNSQIFFILLIKVVWSLKNLII